MRNLLREIGLDLKHLVWIVLLLIGWLAIVIASGAGVNIFSAEWDFSNPGAFGDSFGPLNSIMATVAAVGAIAAYRLQARELADSRKRLEEQDRLFESEKRRSLDRETLLDKRAAHAEFENTFFKLLETFRNVVLSVDVGGSSGNPQTAHDAFKAMVRQLTQFQMTRNNLEESWGELIKKFRNDLNHYFRLLYHIVLFVHEKCEDDRYFYIRIVRALLSESEIILLSLNCEFGDGREKFKPLVECYALLHNVSLEARRQWNMDEYFNVDAFDYKNTKLASVSS